MRVSRAAICGRPGARGAGDRLGGELGAGKTTLVAGLLRRWARRRGAQPNLHADRAYRLRGREVDHCDLYRLRDPAELEDLGLRDSPGRVLLVEWPERRRAGSDSAILLITLGYVERTGRSVDFAPASEAGDDDSCSTFVRGLEPL